LESSDDSEFPEPSDVSSTASSQTGTLGPHSKLAPGKSSRPTNPPASSRPGTSIGIKPGAKPYKSPPTKAIAPANDVIRIGYSRADKKPNEIEKRLDDSSSIASTSVIDPSEVSEEARKGKAASVPSHHKSVSSGSSDRAAADPSGLKVEKLSSGPSGHNSEKIDSDKPAKLDSETFESDKPAKLDSEKFESDKPAETFESDKPAEIDLEKFDSGKPAEIESEKFESDAAESVKEAPATDPHVDSVDDSQGFEDFENQDQVELPVDSLATSLISKIKDDDPPSDVDSPRDFSLSDADIEHSDEQPAPADDDGTLGDDFEQDFS
jgi:hypothetical protein